MHNNRKEYEDENGKLPAPYAIVFSQDWGNKKIPSLKEMLRTLPGLEDMIPDIKFQYFRICESTLKEIADCEELTGLFFLLSRLAYDPRSNFEEELSELAKHWSKCIALNNRDGRFKDGLTCCRAYQLYIKDRRPQTPSVEEVSEKMQLPKLVYDESGFVQDFFPSFYADIDGRLKAAVEARKKAEADARRAKKSADRKTAEANREVTELTTKLRKILLDNVQKKFSNSSHHKLDEMICSIKDTATFDKVYELCQEYETVESVTNAVQALLREN